LGLLGKEHLNNRYIRDIAALIAIASTLLTVKEFYEQFVVQHDGSVITADEIFWLSIKDSANAALFDEFIDKFPQSVHVREARIRRDQLKKGDFVPPPPPPPPPPLPPPPKSASAPPTINSVTPVAAVNSKYIVITGSGFGNAPPKIDPIGDGSVNTSACSTTTPSLAIRNNRAGAGWSAGRATCTNFDAIGIIQNQNPSPPYWWSDTVIVLWGFGPALGQPPYNIAPGDPLSIVVFGANNSGMATFSESVVDESVALSPGTIKVRVPANQAWTDAGISLRAGNVVSIKAAGLVSFARDNRPRISPAGFPPNCDAMAPGGRGGFPAPQLPCESLLARIGQNGPIFEVGASRTIKAQESGKLYLGINDNNVGDNSGAWTASVLIEE